MKPETQSDVLNGTQKVVGDDPNKAEKSKSRSERRQDFWKNKKKKMKEASDQLALDSRKPTESGKDESSSSPRKKLRNRNTIAKPDSLKYEPNLNRGFHSKIIQSLSDPRKRQRDAATTKPQINSEKRKTESSVKSKKPKPAPTVDSPEVFDSLSFSLNFINGHVDSFKSAAVKDTRQYVLFIGNLPYNVTKEQLEEHFRKTGGIKAIRIPKERGKDTGKGFAYMEFDGRISHGIALRLHQTTLAGRKINVEFTSIGGNTDARKEKLKQKNQKRRKMKMR